MKTLGEFVAAERRRLRLTTSELARLAQYKKINKGANRIERFEAVGQEVRPFVERLFSALGLSLPAVERQLQVEAIRRNERFLARWLRCHGDEPSPDKIVIRCFAGFYTRHGLHGRAICVAEAVDAARMLARSFSLQVIVPITASSYVLFDESGRAIHLGRS